MAELLCRDCLLTEAICGLVGTEDCVDAPKNVAEYPAPFLGDALAGRDKIVQVDVYLGQGGQLMLGEG